MRCRKIGQRIVTASVQRLHVVSHERTRVGVRDVVIDTLPADITGGLACLGPRSEPVSYRGAAFVWHSSSSLGNEEGPPRDVRWPLGPGMLVVQNRSGLCPNS